MLTLGSRSTSGWLKVFWGLRKIFSGRNKSAAAEHVLEARGRLGAGEDLFREEKVHAL
jgi:hypothetical protein